MKLIIKTIKGEIFNVEVEPTDKVLSLSLWSNLNLSPRSLTLNKNWMPKKGSKSPNKNSSLEERMQRIMSPFLISVSRKVISWSSWSARYHLAILSNSYPSIETCWSTPSSTSSSTSNSTFSTCWTVRSILMKFRSKFFQERSKLPALKCKLNLSVLNLKVTFFKNLARFLNFLFRWSSWRWRILIRWCPQ